MSQPAARDTANMQMETDSCVSHTGLPSVLEEGPRLDLINVETKGGGQEGFLQEGVLGLEQEDSKRLPGRGNEKRGVNTSGSSISRQKMMEMWNWEDSGRYIRPGPLGLLRPTPHLLLCPCRILQLLRENLEEEAIIMKDVPDWKVGPWQAGQGSTPLQQWPGKPGAERGSGC